MVSAKLLGKYVGRLGTFCGVLAMLVCLTGCPPTPPVDACTGFDVDDGDPCTVDTCELDADGAAFAVHTPVECPAGSACNPDTGECEEVECFVDANCDDGLFCNGAETCVGNECVAGDDPCFADQFCDEDDDVCLDCVEDADCDDADLCTIDSCVDGECAYGQVVCEDGFECDPDTGECVEIPEPECLVDGDCDDGDLCTDDACVDGECVFTDVVCPEGETCDELTGECVGECVVALDCDDGDLCTEDVCDDGMCQNNAIDHDDGLFCNGVETCDPDTGDTVDGPDPCTAGTQRCEEDTDECIDLTTCTVDADCDDGVFCNGEETCDLTDPAAGVCAPGTDPCLPDETCDEDANMCIAPAGGAFTLTTGTDAGEAFTGGSGDDVFTGALFLSGGNFFLTLNNADVLDGAAGTDTLSAQFNPAAATTTTPSMPNIEVFNFEVTTGNPQTVSMGNAGSQTTINFNNSQTDGGDLLITNVANKPTNFGMTNCTENFTVTMADAALAGTTDECTLTLDGVTLTGGEPTILIRPFTAARSGYETINIVSQGGVVNSIQDLQQGNGNSLTTINVSGAAALDMNANAVDTTVTTFDASAAGGDVDVLVPGDGAAGTAITVNGGAGDDELDCTDTADENFTVNGGAGDDKITFNANYDSATPFTDTIDGGDGTDILVVVSADAVATVVQSAVSNIETLEVSNALAGNLDAGQYWGAITKVTLAAGIDGTARTITLPNAGTLDVDADAGAATHVLVVSGTGTSDAVTVDLAAGVDFPNPVTVTGIEELTIAGPTTAGVKNDFGNTVTLTASAGGSTKIILTGANELEFSAALTAGIVDGSACTGVIDIQANMAGACSILGGTAADTLTGSNSNDVINGGPGADIIDGQDGDDTLTGGAGADTFYTVDGDQSTTPSSSIYSTITDFESDSDIIDDTAAALSIVSGTTNFGAATASISSEGFCTFNSADDTLQERIVAAEDGIVENGAAAAGQFCIFTHSTHTYIFISEGTDGLDAGDVLIQLNGVTGLSDTTITGGNLTIK